MIHPSKMLSRGTASLAFALLLKALAATPAHHAQLGDVNEAQKARTPARRADPSALRPPALPGAASRPGLGDPGPTGRRPTCRPTTCCSMPSTAATSATPARRWRAAPTWARATVLGMTPVRAVGRCRPRRHHLPAAVAARRRRRRVAPVSAAAATRPPPAGPPGAACREGRADASRRVARRRCSPGHRAGAPLPSRAGAPGDQHQPRHRRRRRRASSAFRRGVAAMTRRSRPGRG